MIKKKYISSISFLTLLCAQFGTALAVYKGSNSKSSRSSSSGAVRKPGGSKSVSRPTKSSKSSSGRSASGGGAKKTTTSSSQSMIAANSQVLIQPGDAATEIITDATTVNPVSLLLHASIVTKDPMPRADYATLINNQAKPIAQLIAEGKETLQTSDTLTAAQIDNLRGRFIQLLSTAPVIVKVPTASNIIPDARIISGQTSMGNATNLVTIANLDANRYSNQQLGDIVIVSKKYITNTQLDTLRVTYWNQALQPQVSQAKASTSKTVSAGLKNALKTLLLTGWANAFVPEQTMPESVLVGASFVNAATEAVTAATVTGLFADQLSKLVIKSAPNLTATQFSALQAKIQTDINPNLANPDLLKTNLAALLATNQVAVFVAPHVVVQTFAATTLRGQGNESTATVPVSSTNIASLSNDQLSNLVIKSIDGLTQAQIDALRTQVNALGTNATTIKSKLPALLATNQVTVFAAPQAATTPTTLPAATLLGQGNESAATVAVTTANLASLYDDQFAKLVIRSVDGLTQEQINVLMTQLAALGSDVATVKANLPALLATNQVTVFVGPHQAPQTFAAQTLLGAGNEAIATVAVTAANVASLFDDQFTKLVIKSVDGLTQEQINALMTQLAALGSDVATVKTNLPALLATNQVTVFVGPHQETLLSSAINLETGQVADTTGRSIVDTAGIDALTAEQLGNIIFVSRLNIPESEYQAAVQEYTTTNLAIGLNTVRSNLGSTAIVNQIRTTVKNFMQKPTISGKIDIYAPAATPAQTVDNSALIAQIQAMTIPTDAWVMPDTVPGFVDIIIKLGTKANATLRAGATDTAGLITKIKDSQSLLNSSYIFSGMYVAQTIPTAPLQTIKDSLIQGLTEGILDVTIAP